jgi:hypothetical protein
VGADLVLAFLWIVAAAVTFAVEWSIARLLFLLDVDRGQVAGAPETPPRTMIVWTLAAGDSYRAMLDKSGRKSVDLRDPYSREKLPSDSDDAGVLEIDHLECVLTDEKAHAAVLDVLEKRRARREKHATVITSEVDPLRWQSARVREAVDDLQLASNEDQRKEPRAREASADALRARWALLLSGFERIRWSLPWPADEAHEDARAAALLADKYFSTAHRLGSSVSRDDLDDALEPRHWQIWNQCSRAERLALRHLAEEGFLNPNSQDTVRPLFRRLLIRRSPAFVLPSASFRRFVLRAERPETVSTWEQSGTTGGWARLRTPLIATAAIIVAYLLIAEPGAFNWSIAFATAVTAGLPVILKVLTLFGEQRTGAASR